MLVKVLTLRFDPRVDGFDDTALATFTRGKEVLSVRDNFFVRDDVPYWSFFVSYNLPPREGEPVPGRTPEGETGKRSYRQLLDESTWPLFNALRDWRAGRAKAEGVPVYLVLTNDVLAEVVKRRPRTLNELGQIPGFGAAKVKRLGRDLLAQLGTPVPEAAPPEVPPVAPPPAATAAAPPREAPGLFERVVGFGNLLLATRKAVRGKKHRPDVQRLLADLEPAFEARSIRQSYACRPGKGMHVAGHVAHASTFRLRTKLFEAFSTGGVRA